MKDEEILETIKLMEENNLVESHEKLYEKLCLIHEYNETNDHLYYVSKKLNELNKTQEDNQ